MGSQTGTSSDKTGCKKGQTREIQSSQYQKDKLKASVFKLILKMQNVLFLFISTCICSMMQFFDCGVPGKFQLLQILEICNEGPKRERQLY